jgi:hypothetical protein
VPDPFADLISSAIQCATSPYQHFTFHCDFSGLNICVFNYVNPGELPFHCSRSNLASCYFLPPQLVPFPSIPLGQFLNCHCCSQILSLSVSSVNFIRKPCPHSAYFTPRYKCLLCIHSLLGTLGFRDMPHTPSCSCVKMKI